MLTLHASTSRVMVTGLGQLTNATQRQSVRRQLREVLDQVSLCGEPDRVYYGNDGVVDAVSWGIAQGTVSDAVRRACTVIHHNNVRANINTHQT